MDPELQTLGVQLGEAAVRNTASAIFDRIGAAKARRQNQEIIAELEQIVNDLIADKAELVRIAQAFEQEMVAQRISAEDVEYITANIVPVLEKMMESAAKDDAEDAPAQAVMDLIKPILSVETVTVLQLLGFNFRKAIGEPLTTLVSTAILSKAQSNPTLDLEIQKLGLQRELAFFEVAKDAEAYARLRQ